MFVSLLSWTGREEISHTSQDHQRLIRKEKNQRSRVRQMKVQRHRHRIRLMSKKKPIE
jgi:hypothetical protein